MKSARSLGVLLIVLLFTNQPALGQATSGNSKVIHVAAEIQSGTSVMVVNHFDQSIDSSEADLWISGLRGADQQVHLPHGDRIVWNVKSNRYTAEPTAHDSDTKVQPEIYKIYQEVLISVVRNDTSSSNRQGGESEQYVATIHYF